MAPDLRIVAPLALAGFLAGWAPAAAGREPAPALPSSHFEVREGGIVRADLKTKSIALAFTGHLFAEGGQTILDELAKHEARGAFFFTGEFCANTNFAALIERIRHDGHYLGPHSDQHLLYCPWDGTKRTLVTRDEFRSDLEANLQKIVKFGVKRADLRYFLPPYEHYNRDIAAWTDELSMTLVNFSPGTRSNADYTGEADTNFVSSQAIFDSIVAKEREQPHGLNGFILLLHIGSGPGRADKFHPRFGELLDYLARKGYRFVRVDELLEPRSPKNENEKAQAN
jgi:peptidoglycan/xylan/chitin deacetylase (PgdA/CDA1 family)